MGKWLHTLSAGLWCFDVTTDVIFIVLWYRVVTQSGSVTTGDLEGFPVDVLTALLFVSVAGALLIVLLRWVVYRTRFTHFGDPSSWLAIPPAALLMGPCLPADDFERIDELHRWNGALDLINIVLEDVPQLLVSVLYLRWEAEQLGLESFGDLTEQLQLGTIQVVIPTLKVIGAAAAAGFVLLRSLWKVTRSKDAKFE